MDNVGRSNMLITSGGQLRVKTTKFTRKGLNLA